MIRALAYIPFLCAYLCTSVVLDWCYFQVMDLYPKPSVCVANVFIDERGKEIPTGCTPGFQGNVLFLLPGYDI